MKTKQKITLYDIVVVALMAAIVFVVTMFLSIKVPTPTGQTMIKIANAFCLLAGILFGGWRGGLAAGIGSMFYDMTDPMFISGAWITLLRFFMMGAIAGGISHIGKADGKSPVLNFIASLVAAVASAVFYMGKGVAVAMLAGSALTPALLGELPKLAASSTNVVIAVVISTALAPALRKALDSAHVYDRLSHHAKAI